MKDTDTATVSIERQEAKDKGLSLVHYRILKALQSAGKQGMTYRQIEQVTGYYSILTAQLRSRTARGNDLDNTLGSMGLVREEQHETDGSMGPIIFVITKKGLKVVGK